MPAQLSFYGERGEWGERFENGMVIGKVAHLKDVPFDRVGKYLSPNVTDKEWSSAVGRLSPANWTDSIPLWLNSATVCALSDKVSRHNTPSRAHAITKCVRANTVAQSENVVIVCDRKDVFASGCAVARAYPLFHRKTMSGGPKGGDGANGSTATYPNKPRNLSQYPVKVHFIVANGGDVSGEELKALEDAAEGIQLAGKIVDTPCNEMHTDAFVDEAKQVADKLKVKLTVIRGEELKERGMGGIYGVGKAAEHPPALAVLSHEPAGATETIAWVGKGIVYDTGGLSIKGKTAMPGMKRDCGGAAGILGAFYAAVRQGFKQNLHAVLCLAENSVSERATRPDDVHTLYSGKTVEINNTDAEGRLVLADGVVYAARDLGATTILNMCTLTGAQGVATGRFHAAYLTNQEAWEPYVMQAGRNSGDLSFPIVYSPEMHFFEFSSTVADMKNSVADRSNATSSCAGLFINAHLGFDFPGTWLHVDMASPVSSADRGTGYGVALLNTLFGRFSASSLLQEISPLPDNDAENGGTKAKRSKTE